MANWPLTLAVISGCLLPAVAPAPSVAAAVAIANPASVHCVKIGGKSKIRTDAAGNQVGFCKLPDGRTCEEWALFRDRKCVAPKRLKK